MKVVGEAAAGGSVETVWGALHDAAALSRAIPGCEHFEVTGPGLGEFVATTALPAIGGTYAGKLTITGQQRPSLLKLTASVTGDQGAVAADVTLRLREAADATTLVSYEANGTVTGPVAAVGTRLLSSAAKRIAGELFAGLDESVTADVATPPTSAATAAVGPAATELDGPAADVRLAVVAGAAIGLAGIVIGVLAGRRAGRAGRVRT